MDPNPDYRILTLTDVNQAAQVISQAFEDDPLCMFMLPRKKTRTKTLYKFFRALGERQNVRQVAARNAGADDLIHFSPRLGWRISASGAV